MVTDDGPEGPHVTDEELLATACLLLIAGHETTVNLITNGMLTLLRHPDGARAAAPRARPGHSAGRGAAALRAAGALPARSRATLDDIEIAGTTIPKGSPVTLVLASGSRDPAASRPTPTASTPTATATTSTSASAAASTTASARPWPGWRPRSRCAELALRLVNPRLVADPPPYRTNPVLRGPRHLLVDFDGVTPARP